MSKGQGQSLFSGAPWWDKRQQAQTGKQEAPSEQEKKLLYWVIECWKMLFSSYTRELSMTFQLNDQYTHVRFVRNRSYCSSLMMIFDNKQSSAEIYSLPWESIFCILFMPWHKRTCSPASCPKEIFGKYLELIKLIIVHTWPKHL